MASGIWITFVMRLLLLTWYVVTSFFLVVGVCEAMPIEHLPDLLRFGSID